MKAQKLSGVLVYGGMSLLVLLLLYAGGTFWLEHYVRRQLADKVMQVGGGLYRLEIANVAVMPLTGSARMEGVRLYTDTAQYHRQKDTSSLPMVEASVDRIEVNHVKLLAYLFNNQVKAERILIAGPHADLENRGNAGGGKKKQGKNILDALPEKLAPFAASAAIDYITVQELSFRYLSQGKGGMAQHQGDSIGLALRDVLIDDTTRRPFYAREFTFTCGRYEYSTPDTLYKLVVRGTQAESESGKLVMRNVSYLPYGDDGAFDRKNVYQHDRYNVGIDRIEATGLDYYGLFHQKKLVVGRIDLSNANVRLFRDRNKPKNPDQKGFMPNDFFRKLPLYVRVGEANVQDVDLTYEELVKNAPEPAVLKFLNTSATLTNLSNDAQLMTPQHPATLTGQSYLYGKGRLEIRASIPLLQPTLQGHLEGNLTDTQASIFNQILAPYTNYAIREGHIDKLSFTADIVDGTAKGEFTSSYRDLSLRVTNKQGETKELLTLLGNIVLEGANRKGKKGEASATVPIRHSHKEGDNFIFFVWSTIREGILKTLKPEILE